MTFLSRQDVTSNHPPVVSIDLSEEFGIVYKSLRPLLPPSPNSDRLIKTMFDEMIHLFIDRLNRGALGPGHMENFNILDSPAFIYIFDQNHDLGNRVSELANELEVSFKFIIVTLLHKLHMFGLLELNISLDYAVVSISPMNLLILRKLTC